MCAAFTHVELADGGQLTASDAPRHLRTLWDAEVSEFGPSIRVVADSYATLRGLELAVTDFGTLDVEAVELMAEVTGGEVAFAAEQAARAWYQSACRGAVPRAAFSIPPLEEPAMTFCEARESLSDDGTLKPPAELDMASQEVREAARSLHEQAPDRVRDAARRYREQAFVMAGLLFPDRTEGDAWGDEWDRLTSAEYENSARQLNLEVCSK